MHNYTNCISNHNSNSINSNINNNNNNGPILSTSSRCPVESWRRGTLHHQPILLSELSGLGSTRFQQGNRVLRGLRRRSSLPPLPSTRPGWRCGKQSWDLDAKQNWDQHAPIECGSWHKLFHNTCTRLTRCQQQKVIERRREWSCPGCALLFCQTNPSNQSNQHLHTEVASGGVTTGANIDSSEKTTETSQCCVYKIKTEEANNRSDRETTRNDGGRIRSSETPEGITEMLAVELVVSKRKRLQLYNVNIPPIRSSRRENRTDENSLNNLPHGNNTILVGDFYCHTTLWDRYSTTDLRGNQMEEWLADKMLTVNNEGKTRVFRSTGSWTTPNPAITHSSMSEAVNFKYSMSSAQTSCKLKYLSS